MKKVFICLILSIFLLSCSNNIVSNEQDINWITKINIVATITPLASIAKFIWWDNVEVNSIIKPGFSPHTFDLKPSHIKQISQADIILSTWLEIDSFILNNESNNNNNNIVELKSHVTLLEWHEHNHDEHGEEEHHDEHAEEEHHDEHGEEESSVYYDPHFWLSLENWNKIAKEIKNNLIKIDSVNTKTYESNYLSFIDESNKIKNHFYQKIEWKKTQHFIIFHEAYNYLFNEFWIDEEYVVVLEETAWREPSVSDMKNILDTIVINNITTIYKEPQFESKLIEMLQEQQYNLEVDILDPLWQWVDKYSYLYNIEQNLNNLMKIYE